MLAALFDIHGNLPALEAVLDDAQAAGATGFILGGDYAAFGAWPVECVERLDGLDAVTRIRGNWERWQAGDGDPPPDNEVVQGALRAVRDALGDELVIRLGALPDTAVVDGTLVCHASPRSDMTPIPREGDPAQDAELLAGVKERRVVFGHTHLQFQRAGDRGIELVNPGSVGLPWDGDVRAAYALIDESRVELRRVAYDHARAVIALEALEGPWAQKTARRLREARFDV